MKSTKIPFISREQSYFQSRFLSEYLWYGILVLIFVFFLVNGLVKSGRHFVESWFGGSKSYAVGQTVQLEGELGESLGNGLLEFKQGNELSRGVKSKVIDLSKYQGKSILQGMIADAMNDGRYIVDVSRVYQVIDTTKPNLLTKYYDIGL